MSSPGYFCDVRSCPLHGRFGGQSGPSGFFPSVSRDPIRGERPSSADATETPSSCQDGPLAYGGADPQRASRGVVLVRFRYRLDHVLGHNFLPSRPRNTDRAGAVEAGDRADQHLQGRPSDAQVNAQVTLA
jgi:hypothetical protein